MLRPNSSGLVRLVVAVCVVALLLVAGCGRGKPAGSGGEATSTPGATSTPPATPTPDMNATVIPEIAKALEPLNAFKGEHGDPAQAKEGRIRIPRIGVDAAIDAKAAPASLDLSNANPLGPTDLVWYDTKANPFYGGEPGKGKNALLSGHVDYNYAVHWADEAHFRGAGVLAGISKLQPNDAIEVTFHGETSRYGVQWVKQMPQTSDWGAVYAANVPEGDAITLISCTGDFNPATQEYDARTVVRAKRY